MPKIIQFPHPGGEHSKSSGQTWNNGPHKRKFMKYEGSILIDDKVKDGDIEFWGEFEPPAVLLDEFQNNQSPMPRFLFKPIRISGNAIGVNSDPYIFGCFAYTICRKFKGGKSTVLNNGLDKGDILLFGSGIDDKFVLDTLFVVGNAITINKSNYQQKAKKYGSTFIKAALDPIFTINNNYVKGEAQVDKSKNGCVDNDDSCCDSALEITIHIGATYNEPVNDIYSFVPARISSLNSQGFLRPEINLDGINPNSHQNYKYIIKSGSIDEVNELWKEIKNQVLKQQLYPAIGINKL